MGNEGRGAQVDSTAAPVALVDSPQPTPARVDERRGYPYSGASYRAIERFGDTYLSLVEHRRLTNFFRSLWRAFAAVWVAMRCPTLTVVLTRSPQGELIRRYLTQSRFGIPRRKFLQGVLIIPEEYSDYLRGRHRQAVRTNLGHAQRAGLAVQHLVLAEGLPAVQKAAGQHQMDAPVEKFFIIDNDRSIATAYLTVDRDVALLNMLGGETSDARWLLHAAVVQRLCGSVGVLLVEASTVPLLAPGLRHFQHLLGYRIFRLRVLRERLSFSVTGVLSCLAAAFISLVAVAPNPVPADGQKALVWVGALICVRLLSGVAGSALMTGIVASLAVGVVFGRPVETAAVYGLAGALLEVLLGIRLFVNPTRRAAALLGIALISVAAVAPQFPTLDRHMKSAPWFIPPLVAAILFGAAAGVVGQMVAVSLRRRMVLPRLGSTTA